MTLERLLGGVDGWPHVVLGPVLLALVGPVSRAVGVDTTACAVFLAVFTGYGVVVLLGLRGGGAPGWLVAVSIAVNVLFVVVAALSLARGGTTPLGSAVHVVLILSGAAVATLIVVLSRRRLGTGRGRGAATVG